MSENQNNPSVGCKIQRSGGVFFSIAGMFAGHGFNAYDLARTASRQGGNIVAVANRFAENAQAPFTAFVRSMKEINPTTFEGFCNNRHCMETVFVGIEDGIPKLSVRCFRVTTQGTNIKVQHADDRDCPGDCPTGATDVSLGNHNNADAVFNRTQRFWLVKGIIAGIDELIGEEIRFSPGNTALPVSILMIDADGPRRAPGHQGLCPDVNQSDGTQNQ
jgi:hypothetical protein